MSACGPTVGATGGDDASGSSSDASGGSEAGSEPTSTTSETSGADTTAGTPDDLLPASVCALAPDVEDTSPPGSECSPGKAQPHGLCHEIVELELPIDFIQATELFDVNADGLVDVVLSGADWIGAAVSNEGAWPQMKAVSYRAPVSPGSPANFEGGLAATDFDGDGHADLLIGRDVTVFSGSGQGSFAARLGTPVPAPLFDTLAFDVGEDGFEDVVTLHVDGTVSTLHSLGNRQLATDWVRSSVCLEPTAFGHADMDGDGVPELIVAASDNVTVFSSDGSGAFDPWVGADGMGLVVALAAADVTGDGVPEIAVADAQAGVIRLLAFTGLGLAPLGELPYEGTVSALAFADLQGDGAPDLVVTSEEERLLSWAHNDGGGGFLAFDSVDALFDAADLLLEDIDGDGQLDALVFESTGGGFSRIYGTPDGGFSGADLDATTSQHRASALADVDGDGLPDLISALDGQVAVTPNEGGSFGAPGLTRLPEWSDDARFVLRANLDGDDHPDVIVLGDTITTMTLFGDGQALTPGHHTTPMRAASARLTVADFDGDGDDDFIANGMNSVDAWRATGRGGLEGPTPLVPLDAIPTTHAAGDIDGDGNQDVVVIAPFSTNGWSVLGDGAGGFSDSMPVPLDDEGTGTVLEDLDQDGVLDLVTEVDLGGGIVILPGLGDGTFGQPEDLLPDHQRPIVGDFNGDGVLDVVGYSFLNGAHSIIVGEGEGAFSEPVEYPSEFPGIFPSAGDLNGDGLDDALLLGQFSTLRLLLSNPCGCGG
jgi:hypothetical protein